jgi:hypothetical protein
MKQITITLALVAMLFACMAVCGSVSAADGTGRVQTTNMAPAGYSSYSNDAAGVSFMYPPSWNKQENILDSVVAFVKNDRSSVNLVAQDMMKVYKKPLTLDEIDSLNLKQLKQIIKDMKIVENTPTEFHGHDARLIKYTGRFNEKDYLWEQIVFTRGNTVYTLTYTAPPDKYDANAAEAYGIMDSIKLK